MMGKGVVWLIWAPIGTTVPDEWIKAHCGDYQHHFELLIREPSYKPNGEWAEWYITLEKTLIRDVGTQEMETPWKKIAHRSARG